MKPGRPKMRWMDSIKEATVALSLQALGKAVNVRTF